MYIVMFAFEVVHGLDQPLLRFLVRLRHSRISHGASLFIPYSLNSTRCFPIHSLFLIQPQGLSLSSKGASLFSPGASLFSPGTSVFSNFWLRSGGWSRQTTSASPRPPSNGNPFNQIQSNLDKSTRFRHSSNSCAAVTNLRPTTMNKWGSKFISI